MPTDREIEIADAVAAVYEWIDSQAHAGGVQCYRCGKCCDFENYDHRLFVSGPELIYFGVKLDGEKPKPMPAGKCPYNINGECTVYPYRFGGCRIFFCKADKDLQNKLSEESSDKFKSICKEFNIGYRYTDLDTALNEALI